MSTITLYSGKVNAMPTLISDIKTATNDLKGLFSSFSKKCSLVNQSVCNLDDVIQTVSSATKIQETKIASLESFKTLVTDFTTSAARIDENVADYINQNKDDFYDKYSYLKPDCEKDGWDKFCDGCKKVGEWCAENWQAICVVVAAVIAIVAIVALSVVTFGAAAVALAALAGAVVGLVGQFIGDVIEFVRTGSWGGTVWDYIGAMFGGAIGSILTLSCGAVVACSVDGAISSMISDSLTSFTSDNKMSLGDMLLNASVNAAFGAACSFAFGKLTDKLCSRIAKKIPALKRLSGRGSYAASYKMVLTKLKNGTIQNFSWKSIRNGTIAGLAGDFFKNILSGFDIVDLTVLLIKKLELPEKPNHSVYIPAIG